MRHRMAFLLLLVTPVFGFAAEKPAFPPLPAAVSSLGAITCDGYAYVYGGHAGKTHSYDTKTVVGTFHRLKLDGGTKWEELPGGPLLQGMNLASHGGKVYRVGGMSPRNEPGQPADNLSLADAAVYDPQAGKWTSLPPMPAGRSSHDLVVVGDKLVVVGGWNQKGKGQSSDWHDTALTLDLKAKTLEWKSIPQSFQRRALTAAVVGTKVYVLGGLSAKAASQTNVDVLDTATGKWTSGPTFPGEGVGFSPAATTINGRVILSCSDAKVYRLTEAGDAWEKVGESTTKRMVARLLPFGSEVLLVGGASRSGNIANLEVVKLAEHGEKVTAADTK
ncbi:Kelch repeat-containing protein [Limnoglobus roseus]|uniref:Kelch repeat-containing protein n=1 Tax=Limnoglobus roseus TaxID=2598579 RepID=A0A5C1AR07_9BACT|nr:kelch repeat-containing protein [Limnoglobus roseus]QEL21055.1 kelch repeat-containing protein [Limnoglobus roseus]